MDGDRMWVVLGMEVVGQDGAVLGVVQQLRSPGFFVGDTRHQAVYVPFAAIAEVTGNVLVLTRTATALARLN
jgi:ribosomal 30S subunit maturation factor RimM